MVRKMSRVFTVILMCLTFAACEKEYSVENGLLPGASGGGGTSSGTAVYTLTGAPGACVTPVVSGVFATGTALNSSNTVIITVNVTTVGTYAISTGAANGISFSGSGTFTFTGAQAIQLTGAGIPVSAGTFSYTPGTNGCTFSITIAGAVAPGFIKCKIDGVDKNFTFLATATRSFGGASGSLFSATGFISATSTEAIDLGLTGLDFPPGTYEEEGVSPTAIAFADGSYFGAGASGFWLTGDNPTIPNPNPFKIVITAISATRVTGTFQGGMYNSTTSNEKVFTAGSFDLPMQ